MVGVSSSSRISKFTGVSQGGIYGNGVSGIPGISGGTNNPSLQGDYVAEDGSTFYVAENGIDNYVTET